MSEQSEGEGVKRFLSGAESAKPESSEAEAWPMCSFSLEFTQLQSNWKIEIRDEFGLKDKCWVVFWARDGCLGGFLVRSLSMRPLVLLTSRSLP